MKGKSFAGRSGGDNLDASVDRYLDYLGLESVVVSHLQGAAMTFLVL
jgi:hypothetical protein